MQEEITSQLSRQMLLFHRLYSEKISRRFRALHMDATSQAEFLLMAIVTEHGEIPMSELCDRAMMLKQQVTRLVNQLEEKGLVQNYKDFAENLVVQLDPDDPYAMQFLMPAHLIKQFFISKTKIQFD